MTEPSKADATWTIEGTGTQPSLTFEVKRNAIKDSESNKALGFEKWTKSDGDNPQPRYQYVFEVEYKSWAEMFNAVIVSTGWKIGDACRKEVYEPNAHLERVGAKDVVTLNEGAEPIKLVLPADRVKTVRKPMTVPEMIADIMARKEAGTLSDEDKEQLAEMGISM